MVATRTLASVWVLACLAWCSGAEAQTTIAGGNTGTATWTRSGSPYLVNGDVTVQAGAVLTIEAGVEILIASSDGLRAGRDPSRVQFLALGAYCAPS